MRTVPSSDADRTRDPSGLKEIPFTAKLCSKLLHFSSGTNNAFQMRTIPPSDPDMILVSSEVNDTPLTFPVRSTSL